MIDSHCHINFDSYDDDRDWVLFRAREAGVTRIINPAVDLESGRTILRLIERYENIYGAVGVHPNSTADFESAWLDEIEAQAVHTRVVAIGEIGLDYHWDNSPKHKQLEAFEAQLTLAAKLELPVIIHNREAHEDVMTILESWAATLSPSLRDRPGVLHSFSAPLGISERALQVGFYLGFTGPITYKNADELRHVAAHTPLERMVVETDGPFLTPTPHRGKRNEPAYIPLIVERLAALKQVSFEVIANTTTENTERLFKLPPAQDENGPAPSHPQ